MSNANQTTGSCVTLESLPEIGQRWAGPSFSSRAIDARMRWSGRSKTVPAGTQRVSMTMRRF
jgi:hypothetical protein